MSQGKSVKQIRGNHFDVHGPFWIHHKIHVEQRSAINQTDLAM